MTLLGSRGHPFRARGWVHVATALVLAASLAGCGPAETGLQRDAARQLQERVLSVSRAAAANDHTAALQALDSLEAELATAAGNGQVSEERRRSITTVITAVRADLIAAVDAAAAKAAQEATAAEVEKAEAEKAEAEAEAAEKADQEGTAPVAPAPAPVPAPAPADNGKGNENKAKGKNG